MRRAGLSASAEHLVILNHAYAR